MINAEITAMLITASGSCSALSGIILRPCASTNTREARQRKVLSGIEFQSIEEHMYRDE